MFRPAIVAAVCRMSPAYSMRRLACGGAAVRVLLYWLITELACLFNIIARLTPFVSMGG
jgi:hypothetical protein